MKSAGHSRTAGKWLRDCAYVGKDPLLIGRPTVITGGSLRIGDRFRLASTPVPSHMNVGDDATLEIGDDVAIGCGAAISAYESVRIGSGTLIGPFVIIMDTNFHAAGDQSLVHDCRPVSIGAGCRIGSRVTITRGVTIGDGAEVLAGSVVASSVPAGACAAGSRARIIGRAGDSGTRWHRAAAALPEMLMATLELSSAPDLDDTALPAGQWWPEAIERLRRELVLRFGGAPESSRLLSATTFAEVATLATDATA